MQIHDISRLGGPPEDGREVPLLAVPSGMEIGHARDLHGRLTAIVEPHPLDEFMPLGRSLSPTNPILHGDL